MTGIDQTLPPQLDSSLDNSPEKQPGEPEAELVTEPLLESMAQPPEPPEEPPAAPENGPIDEPFDESLLPSWEDDETPATFFLRAVATLVCGGFLAWSQYFANIPTTTAMPEWLRWINLSVVANLLFPLGIIWMFFGQGVQHLDWLKDQRSNAWSYGWNFRDWRRHLKWSLIMSGAMLVIMVIFRLTPAGHVAAESYVRGYFPPIAGPGHMAILFASLVVYMFCWEFFFRGFLLFGMAQGVGPIVAIILQAALFGLAHYGKPEAEYYSSFAGGALLGVICWREKSFAPAFYTHGLIHLLWAILVLLPI